MSIINLKRVLPKALVACLVVVAAASFVGEPIAWAQQTRAGTTVKTKTSTSQQAKTGAMAAVASLQAQGYRIAGPVPVADYTGKILTLTTGRKGLRFDLNGKDLTVYDMNAKLVSERDIVKDARVYVCTKASKVTIFVLPKDSTLLEGGPTNATH